MSWRGSESIAEVARKLAKRKAVVLSLPRSFHHVLCVRLSDHARLHGMLDVSGGPDLLGRLAEITGLHDLARLREPVSLAGAGVRVHSPPPQVHLFFPKAGSRRVWHSHLRREPIDIAVQQPAGGIRP